MKAKSVVLLFVLGVFLFVPACGGGTAGYCTASMLGAPGGLSPAGGTVVSLSPTLQWEYPSSAPSPYPYPAGSSDCLISGYQVHLVRSYGSGELGGEVDSSTTSFSPSAPLQPASQYFCASWRSICMDPGVVGAHFTLDLYAIRWRRPLPIRRRG